MFITTFNNADTLSACLESVKWADEILILDSFSTDACAQIAERYGCVFHQHSFLGYGKQKQLAMEMTKHRWVLLLDADEMLTPELAEEIQDVMRAGPKADGYEMRRQELMYWRMAHPGMHLTYFLRLFDKTKGRLKDMPVHSEPIIPGGTKLKLRNRFYHFGDVDIHRRAEKFNKYSTGLVAERLQRGKSSSPFAMLFYPPLYFLRMFFLHRNFLNGWAGFVTSVNAGYYAFLKCAKAYEHAQVGRYGNTLLPPGSPDLDRTRDVDPV